MGLIKNDLLVLNLCSLKIILRDELQALMSGPEQLEKIPILTSGSEWKDIYGTAGSIQYNLSSSESSPGTVYNQSLSVTYPGLSMSSTRLLHSWRNQEFILQFTIEDHQYYVGNLEAGAKLSWAFQTERDGCVLSFELSDIEPHYSSPELDLFIIENGALIQQFEVEDEFTLSSDGKLQVTGPNENRYSIDGRKLIIS